MTFVYVDKGDDQYRAARAVAMSARLVCNELRVFRNKSEATSFTRTYLSLGLPVALVLEADGPNHAEDLREIEDLVLGARVVIVSPDYRTVYSDSRL